MSDELNLLHRQAIQEACRELVRKHHIAIEALTEQQIADALRQAIACGDFTRNIRITDNAQQVIYVPFAECERLRSRIAELEKCVAWTEVQDPTKFSN